MLQWLSNFIQSRKQGDDEERKTILEHLEANRKAIDDYRSRFKTSPCGHWSQAAGTFGGVMDEIWEFNPDRTGKIVEIGPFGSTQGETLFEWKEVADFTIACKVIKWSYEEEEDVTEAELEEWETIRYDFKMSPTDCGSLIGMYQLSEDATFLKGFWHSVKPLMNNDNW
jgi:hypothetical protein